MAIRLEFQSDAKGVNRDLRSINDSVRNIDKTTQTASNTFANFAKLAGIAASAFATFRANSRVLDSFTLLQNRLALTTGRTEQLNIATGKLRKVSRATNTDINSLAETFNRLTQSAGIGVQRAIELTETLSKAGQIGGGAAASIEDATIQLNQGLAAGQLRGEELNSVLEQLPRVAKLLATELEVPIGRLRSLAAEGKISSKTVENALVNGAAAINKEYELLNLTISQSLQAVNREIGILTRNLFGALGFGSTGISEFFSNLAKSIQELGLVFSFKLATAVTKFNTQLLKIRGNLKGFLGELQLTTSQIFGGLLAATGVLGLISSRFFGFINVLKGLFFGFFIWLVGRSVWPDTMRGILTSTEFAVVATLATFTNFFSNLIRVVKFGLSIPLAAWRGFWNKFLNVIGFRAIQTSVTRVATTVASSFNKFLLPVITTLTGAWRALIGILSSPFKVAFGTIATATKVLGQSVATAMRQYLIPVLSLGARVLAAGVGTAIATAISVANPLLAGATQLALVGSVIAASFLKFLISSERLAKIGAILSQAVRFSIIGLAGTLVIGNAFGFSPATIAEGIKLGFQNSGLTNVFKSLAGFFAINPSLAVFTAAASLQLLRSQGAGGGIFKALGKTFLTPGLIGNVQSERTQLTALRVPVARLEQQLTSFAALRESRQGQIGASRNENRKLLRKFSEFGKDISELPKSGLSPAKQAEELARLTRRRERIRGDVLSNRRGRVSVQNRISRTEREERAVQKSLIDLKAPLDTLRGRLGDLGQVVRDSLTKSIVTLGSIAGTVAGGLLGQRLVETLDPADQFTRIAIPLLAASIGQAVAGAVSGVFAGLISLIFTRLPAVAFAAITRPLIAFFSTVFARIIGIKFIAVTLAAINTQLQRLRIQQFLTSLFSVIANVGGKSLFAGLAVVVATVVNDFRTLSPVFSTLKSTVGTVIGTFRDNSAGIARTLGFFTGAGDALKAFENALGFVRDKFSNLVLVIEDLFTFSNPFESQEGRTVFTNISDFYTKKVPALFNSLFGAEEDLAKGPVITETVTKAEFEQLTKGLPASVVEEILNRNRIVPAPAVTDKAVESEALLTPLEKIEKHLDEIKKGSIPGFATGGLISGPGSGTSDDILAKVSNKEFIVNAKATKKNRALLEAINTGKEIPGFRDGTPSVLGAELSVANAEFLSGITDFFAKFAETISGIDLTGVDLGKRLKDLLGDLRDIDFKDIWSRLVNGAVDIVRELKEQREALKAPVSGGEAASLGQAIADINLGERLQESLSELSGFGIKGVNPRGVDFEGLSPEIQESMLGLTRALNEQLAELNLQQRKGLPLDQDLLETAKNQSRLIAETLATQRELLKAQQKLGLEISEFARETGAAAAESIKGGFSGLLKGIAKGENVADQFKAFSETIFDAFVNTNVEGFTEGLFKGELGKGLSSFFTNRTAVAENDGATLSSNVREGFNDRAAKGPGLLSQGVGLVKGLFGFGKEGSENEGGLKEVVTNATRVIPVRIVSGPDSGGGLLGSALEGVGGDTGGPKPAGDGTVGDSLESAGGGLLTGFKGIFDNVLGNFKGIFDNLLGNFKGVFSNIGGLFSGGGGGGGQGLGGLLGSAFAGLFDKGGTIPTGGFGIVGERGPEIVRGPANVTSRVDTAKALAGGDKNVTFALEGGFDEKTERAIRKMISSGMLQNSLNQANYNAGGDRTVFKG